MYLYGVLLMKFRHEGTDIYDKECGTFLSDKNKKHNLIFRQMTSMENYRRLVMARGL